MLKNDMTDSQSRLETLKRWTADRSLEARHDIDILRRNQAAAAADAATGLSMLSERDKNVLMAFDSHITAVELAKCVKFSLKTDTGTPPEREGSPAQERKDDCVSRLSLRARRAAHCHPLLRPMSELKEDFMQNYRKYRRPPDAIFHRAPRNAASVRPDQISAITVRSAEHNSSTYQPWIPITGDSNQANEFRHREFSLGALQRLRKSIFDTAPSKLMPDELPHPEALYERKDKMANAEEEVEEEEEFEEKHATELKETVQPIPVKKNSQFYDTNFPALLHFDLLKTADQEAPAPDASSSESERNPPSDEPQTESIQAVEEMEQVLDVGTPSMELLEECFLRNEAYFELPHNERVAFLVDRYRIVLSLMIGDGSHYRLNRGIRAALDKPEPRIRTRVTRALRNVQAKEHRMQPTFSSAQPLPARKLRRKLFEDPDAQFEQVTMPDGATIEMPRLFEHRLHGEPGSDRSALVERPNSSAEYDTHNDIVIIGRFPEDRAATGIAAKGRSTAGRPPGNGGEGDG
jgi:hypothetical protein